MTYVLDNADDRALLRLNALAEIFDTDTIQHLEARGVGSGWSCLEVGAGGGSMARWLSSRVGASGFVLATDIDTRHLASLQLPNLEVRKHDIAADPVPVGAFDLVHARLVLNSMPHSTNVLERLVAALKPRGWLVIEEFQSFVGACETASKPAESGTKTTAALWHVMQRAGWDSQYGRSLGARFRAQHLDAVGMVGRAFCWRSGSAGALLTRVNREQLRDAILATGLVARDEFESDLAAIGHQDFEVTSPLLWTAWGQRPTVSRGPA